MAEPKLRPSSGRRWLAAGVVLAVVSSLWLLGERLFELPPVVDAPEPAKTPLQAVVPQPAASEPAAESVLPEEDGIATAPAIPGDTAESDEP